MLARALLAMDLGLLYQDARNRAGDAGVENTTAAMTAVWLASVWGINPGA